MVSFSPRIHVATGIAVVGYTSPLPPQPFRLCHSNRAWTRCRTPLMGRRALYGTKYRGMTHACETLFCWESHVSTSLVYQIPRLYATMESGLERWRSSHVPLCSPFVRISLDESASRHPLRGLLIGQYRPSDACRPCNEHPYWHCRHCPDKSDRAHQVKCEHRNCAYSCSSHRSLPLLTCLLC